MSDANRTSLGLIEEAVLNVMPTNPRFALQRVRAVNLKITPKYKTSEELVADRNITDAILVGIEAGGDVPMEVSYGAIDTMARGNMMSDWIVTPVRDNDGTAAAVISAVSGTQYTFVAAAGSAINSGVFQAAMLVLASGFGVAGNNGLKVITAAAGTTISCAGLAVEATPPAAARLKVVGVQGASGDIAATAGPNTITTAALSWVTMGIIPGMWIKPVNFGITPANNDWVRVRTVSATVLGLDVVPVGWAADAGTGVTVKIIVGDVIRPGTTLRSYSQEVTYADLATVEYDYHTGGRIAKMTLSPGAQDILTVDFAIDSCNGINTTTRAVGATTKAASTNAVMNTSGHVQQIRLNNVLLGGTTFFMGWEISLDNNLRRNTAVGNYGSVAIPSGRIDVQGKLSMYYNGNTAGRSSLLNNTNTSFSAFAFDPTGAMAYHFDVPTCKLTAGDPTMTGIDTDRMFEPTFQGLKDAFFGYALQISRYDYVA